MIAAFINAARPKPVVCLGLPLRPFCLAHLFALLEGNSAFLAGGTRSASPTLTDLMLAVLICSQDHRGTSEIWNDPDLDRDLKSWEKKLRRAARPRRFFSKNSKLKIQNLELSEIRSFQAYLADGLQFPVVKFEVSAGARETSAPAHLFTLTSLLSNLHLDYETAMNLPLPLARWLVAGYGEQQGNLSIVDAEEMAQDRKAADTFAAEVFAEEKARHSSPSPSEGEGRGEGEPKGVS